MMGVDLSVFDRPKHSTAGKTAFGRDYSYSREDLVGPVKHFLRLFLSEKGWKGSLRELGQTLGIDDLKLLSESLAYGSPTLRRFGVTAWQKDGTVSATVKSR